MVKTAKDWNTGDKFVFTESPFPGGSIPTGEYTLRERQGDPENEFQYFYVQYKKTEITVATTWIKESGDE